MESFGQPATAQTEQKKRKPHWHEVKLRRVVMLLAIVFASLFAIAGGLQFVETVFVIPHEISAWQKSVPSFESLPTPLHDQQIATLAGIRVERYGYSVQVPWNAIVRESQSDSSDWLLFRAATTDVSMELTDPDRALPDFIDIAKQSPKDWAEFTAIMGQDAMRSNFDLTQVALSARPENVHWWNSRRSRSRSNMLLMVKVLVAHEARSIYPVAGNSVRGWQFGDAGNPELRLLLFDAQDRQYQIDLSGNGSLTQPQINAVVANFQPRP